MPHYRIVINIMGRRQVVRHQVLVLAFAGSNPAVPAKLRTTLEVVLNFLDYSLVLEKYAAISSPGSCDAPCSLLPREISLKYFGSLYILSTKHS